MATSHTNIFVLLQQHQCQNVTKSGLILSHWIFFREINFTKIFVKMNSRKIVLMSLILWLCTVCVRRTIDLNQTSLFVFPPRNLPSLMVYAVLGEEIMLHRIGTNVVVITYSTYIYVEGRASEHFKR